MIAKHKSILFYLGLVVLLFATNYVPHTYLTGWDNLQTDLNPWLGVKRAIFSVWEEYQSFGLVAGMAHAADLPRALFIWLLSFIVPQSLLRYVFQFLMVFVAAVGMEKLLTFLGLQQDKKIFAIFGSLFYIFNFSVVQMMFLPFESFSVFFGFLPWELWIFLALLQKPTKKTILLFCIINILATPQSVSQQLFAVYGLLLGIFSIGLLLHEHSRVFVKRMLLVFLLLFCINSFWILPQVYFLKTSSTVVEQAKINQLSTDDVFFSNKDKGNLKDFATFTGFFYDRLDGNQQPLFAAWKAYREVPLITPLLYLLSAIALLGMFRKSKYQLSFLGGFLIVAIALLSNTFPFTLVNELIRSNALINQIFRSPFTKFSIVYALVASYFFAMGCVFIYEKVKKVVSGKVVMGIISIIGLLLFVQTIPSFEGNYISPAMKIAIPKEYFSAMDYFKTVDKDKRIGLLPEYTFWGWLNYSWGYNGSGFLWYGIEQPIISRNFDMWSATSEQYYWEVNNALDAENIDAFNHVVDKYAVDYLLLDHSLLPIVSDAKAIQYDRLDAMLAKDSKVTLVKQWGFLSLYQVNRATTTHFTHELQNVPNIGPAFTYGASDVIYQTYGNYQTNSKNAFAAYYPFLDLTSQNAANASWKLSESYANWYLTKKLTINTNDYMVATSSGTMQGVLYNGKQEVNYTLPFTVALEKNVITVTFPKIILDSFMLQNTTINNCGSQKGTNDIQHTDTSITVTSQNGAVGCFGYSDSNLRQQYGYIVKVQSQNLSGQRLYVYVLDKTKNQAYIEDRLNSGNQYYLIGPRFQQGVGYDITFQNTSYTTFPAKNELKDVSVYFMPFHQIQSISLLPKTKEAVSIAYPGAPVASKKISYFLYQTSVPAASKATLVLDQSYSDGWHAYVVDNNSWLATTIPFLFGKEIRNHILVNNWENGWQISNRDSGTIVMVFWPQYLEFAGFGAMLLFSLFSFLKFGHTNRNK